MCNSGRTIGMNSSNNCSKSSSSVINYISQQMALIVIF